MTETIVVSTDGSALGNPNGPMGWAWADHAKDAGDGGEPGHEHDSRGYDAGGATNGTNQIGELCAVLEALRAHPGPQKLIIESDSQYAINCSTKWVKGWKRNGWRNSQKKPVKNRELIEAIDEAISRRPGPVEFKWVKGHAGNAGNELVDELARTYAGDCRSGARDGYLPIEGWRSLLNSEYARGTDVPPDVRLVLDGKVDASLLRGNDEASGAESGTASGAAKPSLADLLAEPEGVPDDIGMGGRDTVPLSSDRTAAQSDDRTTTSQTEGRTTTARSEGRPGKSAKEQPAHPSWTAAEPRNQEKSPNARTGRNTSETGMTSTGPTASPTGLTMSPTGLTVSGAVRFSPAPKTSPYFTGETMHVRGYIAVDGFVDGDGNLTIADAAFLRG